MAVMVVVAMAMAMAMVAMAITQEWWWPTEARLFYDRWR